MTFDIVTIFPAMIEQPLAAGILGRAIERGTLDVKVRDLREFTDRPSSRRGRCAVWRGTRNGPEGRTDFPGA
jgi:tRNA (guanine-N1)-methyltransferase